MFLMAERKVTNRIEGAFKGLMFGTLLTASLVGLSSEAIAAQFHSVSVKVNGKIINMHEASGYIDGKTQVTYVPLRFVSEALGAEINYLSNSKPIVVSIKEPKAHKVSLTLNSTKVVIDGSNKTIVGAAILKNGRTMVPLRVISEGLGAKITFKQAIGSTPAVVEVNTPWDIAIVTTTTDDNSANAVGNTEYTTWKPNKNQVITGPVIFKDLTWDSSNRTLSLLLPSSFTYQKVVYDVQGAYRNGTEEIMLIETNKLLTLTGVSENFFMNIYMSNNSQGLDFATYYVMSTQYAAKHYQYKGVMDDTLLVYTADDQSISYDSKKHLITLKTIYSALKINH